MHRFPEFQIFVKPVSSRCNLQCGYCYYSSHGQQQPTGMTDALMESYIAQHIAASTNSVIAFSWHGGEPTLYGLDGFRKIVALQKKHLPEGCFVVNGIQTNGILIDEEWCRFLSEENFKVGLSLDGTERDHDIFRKTASGESTHRRVMQAYEQLKMHGVETECLCVVHAGNVDRPLEVYEFFRRIHVPYLTFLPLVERGRDGSVGCRTVPSEDWGAFLCAVFDRWLQRDIGHIKVQIFEEAARTAFGLEHTLCIFREACGVPVLESNGDVYACDHFVAPPYKLGNITETPLLKLLECRDILAFGRTKRDTLTRQCLDCDVLDMCNGGCPRNRFIATEDGETGLNYLCAGYRRFFKHCRPFVAALAEVWRRQEGNY
ncbi:MAG: anaerobic sulfatase maturase [Acidobacteriota bacterium]